MTLATGLSVGRTRRKGWVTFGRVGMVLNSSAHALAQGAFKIRTHVVIVQIKRLNLTLILFILHPAARFFHSVGSLLAFGLINFIPTLQR
jgi:hypothetical protein